MDKSPIARTEPSAAKRIARISTPSPLPYSLDYRLNNPLIDTDEPLIGRRVKIQLGKRFAIGFIESLADSSEVPSVRLKNVTAIIDDSPLLPNDLWQLCRWSAQYYQHSLGLVLQKAIPVALRNGQQAKLEGQQFAAATAAGLENTAAQQLSRAPKQKELLAQLRDAQRSLDVIANHKQQAALRELCKKSLAHIIETAPASPQAGTGDQKAPTLNSEQQAAASQLAQSITNEKFSPWLLEGITGSGKTEVYLAAISTALAEQKTVLVLLPEISLTPQVIARFRERLAVPMVVLHSGLNDNQRLTGWLQARDGLAKVVIGTRSAIFTPMPKLGLIVVDEEHDGAFKQQDGLRYSGRDLALVRAQLLNIPVVLGTATPSLESLLNVQQGRYGRLTLTERAGNAKPPAMQVVDIRGQQLQGGLSQTAVNRIRHHLDEGGQVMLFLNRRGFAPVLMCHGCGYSAECEHCDARYTIHQRDSRLRCHHCGHQRYIPKKCPDCNAELSTYGQGTEQLEQVLAERFPDVPTVRIDRDATRRKGSLEEKLEQIRSGEARLLIGTQMLSKGHDFPELSLVVLVDADQGLLAADFRGSERFAQQLVQVAGRSGRAERQGEVMIQTHRPGDPLLRNLLQQGYSEAATTLLAERETALWPPYAAIALFRADASKAKVAEAFLQEAANLLAHKDLSLAGPQPAPMEKRANRYRSQLLVQASDKRVLQKHIASRLAQLHQIPGAARWSVDIDPADLY